MFFVSNTKISSVITQNGFINDIMTLKDRQLKTDN